jgi:hypothetical protein
MDTLYPRYAWLARKQLVDDRRRGKVLRDTGLLDPDYPTGHFDSIIQTMTQVFEVGICITVFLNAHDYT